MDSVAKDPTLAACVRDGQISRLLRPRLGGGGHARPKLKLAVAAIASLAVVLSACSTATAPKPAATHTKDVPIVYGGVGLDIDAGTFVALDRGYFKQEGLNVTYTSVNGGQGATLLATNQIQFAGVGVNPGFFNAITRRAGFDLAAAETEEESKSQQLAFVVRTDLVASGKYRSPRDLKGLTIGITKPQSTVGYLLDAVLRRGGLTESDVNIETGLQYSAQLIALANKRIDAGLMGQPFATQAELQGIGKVVVPDGQIAPGLPLYVAMSRAFYAAHPQEATRFFVAWLHGQRDVWQAVEGNGKDRGLILGILSKYTKTPVSTYQAMLRSGALTGFTRDGIPGAKWVTRLETYFYNHKYITSKPDPQPYIQAAPLRAALKIAGTVKSGGQPVP